MVEYGDQGNERYPKYDPDVDYIRESIVGERQDAGFDKQVRRGLIHQAFPSIGNNKAAHEGSQSSVPSKENQ